MINLCNLTEYELHLIWSIDRREMIENIYYFRGGELVLEPEYYDMQGWPPGAAERAKSLGAKKMYISAVPVENAIHFYQYLGCTLAEEVYAELFELKPEDIHLEYRI